jgi:hypothetical protein
MKSYTIDRTADHQHTLASRKLHLDDMKRRPSFGGEYDQAREAERRLCEDEISHALFCIAHARAQHKGGQG